mgnify:FL=1
MTGPSFFTYSFKSIILVFLHIYGMIEYVYYINRLERLPVYRSGSGSIRQKVYG